MRNLSNCGASASQRSICLKSPLPWAIIFKVPVRLPTTECRRIRTSHHFGPSEKKIFPQKSGTKNTHTRSGFKTRRFSMIMAPRRSSTFFLQCLPNWTWKGRAHPSGRNYYYNIRPVSNQATASTALPILPNYLLESYVASTKTIYVSISAVWKYQLSADFPYRELPFRSEWDSKTIVFCFFKSCTPSQSKLNLVHMYWW